MSTQEENSFQEALTALQNGEKSRARDLLTRLIKINATNPQYWLYMSTVVETPKEIIFCLHEALKLDPHNATAQRGLELQGERPPDPQKIIPIQTQRRNWESQYFSGPSVPGLIEKPTRMRLGLILGAVGVLVMLVVVAIIGLTSINNTDSPPQFIAWLQNYTPAPTSNVTSAPGKAVTGTAVPTLLVAGTPGQTISTSTPAPPYINTPHPRTESYRSAFLAMQRSDWTAAVNYLMQATKEDPKADLYYLLGESYRNLKKTKEALAAFEQAITMDARFAPSYLGRARIRMLTTPEPTEAIRSDLDKAVSLDANFLDAYLELAAFKATHKDPSGAMRDMDTAIRMQPTSALAYAFRARIYLTLNQPDLALADARRANQLDPGDLNGYRLLGETLRANKNLADCIAPLELFLRYVSDDAEVLTWLGQAFAAKGDTTGAMRYLDQALALNPRSFEVRVNRAFVFIDIKESSKAQDELRAASGLNPDSFIVSLGLGRVGLLNNDPSDAWRNFTAALRLAETDTDKAQAYYWRATALELAQSIPSAVQDWNELLRLPAAAVPAGMRDTALQRLQALNTPTPTLRPSSTAPTPMPSPTLRVSPSATITATATASPTPTATRTSTASRSPTPTPTVTRTPTATATKSAP